MRKKLLTFALLPAVAIAATGITVATQTSAHGASSLQIEELAEKLNLDEAQIEAAFKDLKEARKAEFETRKKQGINSSQLRYEDRLSKAVDQGDITEAQKQLILDKRAELKAEMEAKKAELQAWSKKNSIDLKYLTGHKGFWDHHGFHKEPRVLREKIVE